MAATQETLPATQDKLDPRRLGRNNSGLSEQDISDVVCILHPSSPAAFKIVADTAQRNPQHVLQNQGLTVPGNDVDTNQISEADTIILKPSKSDGPRDLALRFSSRVVNPPLGFCFGRNVCKCDMNLDPDHTQVRVSNMHFRIFLNENRILMLEDMSKNGTVVDSIPLGGKKREGEDPNYVWIQREPRSRILSHGSIIEILSLTEDDVIKFILRVPARERFKEQYQANFQNYVHHMQVARNKAKQVPRMPEAHTRAVMAAPLAGPPNSKALPVPAQTISSGSPMQWDGGGRYNCVGLLGKGAFATVYHVATMFEGEFYAAKELEKRRFMKNNQLDTRLDNEMNIMQSLRHENIVRYIEFIETPQFLYIIMEYVPGGDLQGYMQAHGTLPEDSAKAMTKQILDALHYLHQRNITHRDIKPDNILLCSENPFNVKLTDFGLSKVVKNQDTFLKTFCGTLLYCAPEVFPHYQDYVANKRMKRRRQSSGQSSGRRSYGSSVDVWSYAAVLWTALCGNPPFEGVVDPEGRGMFYQIMQSTVDTMQLREFGISDYACDLLQLMLDTDPSTRPSEVECLRHPWLNDGKWLPDQEGLQEQLHDIEEVEEATLDVDASQLSINDRNDQDQQQNSAGSNDSAKAPEAKRIRGEDSFKGGRNEVPLFNDVQNPPPTAMLPPAPQKAQRLFGEISQGVLKSSGVLNGRTGGFSTGYRESQLPELQESWNNSSENYSEGDSRILDWGLELSHTNGDENAPIVPTNLQSAKRENTSLSGAESMVRDLHMADQPHTPSNTQNNANGNSQQHADSNADNADKTPRNPTSKPRPQQSSSSSSVDKTPRPRKPFDRQISLPITASSYYNPYDESTHNIAYASRVSGHDFALHPQTDARGVTSLPETVHASFRSGEGVEPVSAATSVGGIEAPPNNPSSPSHPIESTTAAPPPSQEALTTTGASEFTKPPSRYGRLVSTPDSFTSISLPLTSRYTTWGRLPANTLTYPHPTDTRIPKLALELIFDASGIQQAEETGADWTKLPGLRLLILTRSRAGIWVNGVRLLEKDENEERRYYGRLCEGDIIEVFRPSRADDGAKGLKFTVELVLDGIAKRESTGGFEVLKH